MLLLVFTQTEPQIEHVNYKKRDGAFFMGDLFQATLQTAEATI